jgi:hypothetical protein
MTRRRKISHAEAQAEAAAGEGTAQDARTKQEYDGLRELVDVETVEGALAPILKRGGRVSGTVAQYDRQFLDDLYANPIWIAIEDAYVRAGARYGKRRISQGDAAFEMGLVEESLRLRLRKKLRVESWHHVPGLLANSPRRPLDALERKLAE